jgi:hypothetical protein
VEAGGVLPASVAFLPILSCWATSTILSDTARYV